MAEPQVCSTDVMAILAPSRLGSALDRLISTTAISV
jgi:hypothetical protein